MRHEDILKDTLLAENNVPKKHTHSSLPVEFKYKFKEINDFCIYVRLPLRVWKVLVGVSNEQHLGICAQVGVVTVLVCARVSHYSTYVQYASKKKFPYHSA